MSIEASTLLPAVGTHQEAAPVLHQAPENADQKRRVAQSALQVPTHCAQQLKVSADNGASAAGAAVAYLVQ